MAEVLSRLSDPVATAEAITLSSGARLFRGQIAAAWLPLTEASAVLDAARSDSTRIVHLVLLAWLRGAPDEAMTLPAKRLAQAEVQNDPFHVCTMLTVAALTRIWRCEPEKDLRVRATSASDGSRRGLSRLVES